MLNKKAIPISSADSVQTHNKMYFSSIYSLKVIKPVYEVKADAKDKQDPIFKGTLEAQNAHDGIKLYSSSNYFYCTNLADYSFLKKGQIDKDKDKCVQYKQNQTETKHRNTSTSQC